jgi:predicted nucleic acid-binding Zn ribbon protein
VVDEICGEASNVYLRLKEVFGDSVHRGSRSQRKKSGQKQQSSSVPFGTGRDPAGMCDVVNALTEQLGWNEQLAQSELLAAWPKLVGEETASHAIPVGITEGVLTVQCDSTAWATQLRLMRIPIMDRIGGEFTDAGVESITFKGPGAPSWKKGPRSIPGRGPRDTYG